jgi:hypothetical protein
MPDVRATSLVIDLVLLGGGSDRRIRESLSLDDASELRRDVNGTLRSLGLPEFRKYSLGISGDDLYPPALAGVWAGQQVTVVPATEVGARIPSGQTTVTLPRDPAATTVRCVRADTLAPVEFSQSGAGSRVVTLTDPAPAAGVRVSFRPTLTMLVASWSHDEAEADAEVSWSLDLREV